MHGYCSVLLKQGASDHYQKHKFGLKKQVPSCLRRENMANLLHEVSNGLVIHVVVDVQVHLSVVKWSQMISLFQIHKFGL